MTCSHPRFFVPEDGIRRCALCHEVCPQRARDCCQPAPRDIEGPVHNGGPQGGSDA